MLVRKDGSQEMISMWVVLQEMYDGERTHTTALSVWTSEADAWDEAVRLKKSEFRGSLTKFIIEEVEVKDRARSGVV
jgi:hypothetical protein